MARTVKAEEFASKRREILNATQRLVLTKGYEQMSIQDILNEVQISSGAFHHYFASRGALLDAFIEHIKQQSGEPLLQIVQDAQLSAITKFQGFFDTLDRLRIAHKAEVISIGRVWYSDDNALIRQKVDESVIEMRAPLLNKIVHQGIQEGVFTTTYPDQTGEVIMSLLQGMGNTHARLLLSFEQRRDDAFDATQIDKIVATHEAYMDAIERVLGVPAHTFYRATHEAVKFWVDALRESDPA